MIFINNIYKTLDNQNVLSGVDITIRQGQRLVIIGRSGCGKSVLLKMIIGIMRPDKGQLLVEEKDICKLSEQELYSLRKRFGMVFQGAALFDSMTVAENVSFALKEHQPMLSDSDIFNKVKEVLALVDLKNIEHKKPSQLSGGMKKRVGFARAIATSPDIILYDEPATGLDPIMASVIDNLILKLHDNLSATSIIVTHDMESAYRLGDTIAMLHDGKIIEIGTPAQIRNSDNVFVKQFVRGEIAGPIKV